jgi:hypothetical protein
MSLLAWLVGPETIADAFQALEQQRVAVPQVARRAALQAVERKYGGDPEVWAKKHPQVTHSLEQRLLSYYQGHLDSRLSILRGMTGT